jgi:hypothetical protein
VGLTALRISDYLSRGQGGIHLEEARGPLRLGDKIRCTKYMECAAKLMHLT